MTNPRMQSAKDAEAVLWDFLSAYARRDIAGRGLSKVLGRLIPQSIRPQVRRVATDAIALRQRAVASRLVDGRVLRLNLGCGSLRLDGWVNVDLVGLPIDVAWNINRPLPFPDGSADAVFHEHVAEHLPADRSYIFLKECRRVLKVGGVMRAVVPDAEKYIRSYCDPRHEFLNSWREVEERGLTPLLGLQEEFYGFGHRTIFDFETFEFFCRAAGFENVERRAFGDSRLQPCPDSEWRITDSFYAEMVK